MTTPVANIDNTTLLTLTGNLDIGDVADPALRLTYFQYLNVYIQTITTAFNAFIANGSIGSVNLADLSVLTVKIADLAVTTGKIAELAVTTTKLNDMSVTLAKMAAASVGTTQLVDLSVTRPKIAAGAVGAVQLDPTLLTDYGDIAVQAEFDRRGINVLKYSNLVVGIDWTAAVQAAAAAAENGILFIPSTVNCLITSQITLPNNIIIVCNGEFTCTGDQDYWFNSYHSTRIIFINFKATVTKTFALRTLLNRVIFCDTPTYLSVQNAEIIGASTAIHCLNGDDFFCSNTILKNTYGIDAQYGYGINTSAKRSTISKTTAINDDTTNGRHVIYINGAQWENVTISDLYVNNWNRNPVNIINTDTNAKSYAYVNNAVFENANIVPTADTTGCIHGGAENGVGVRIHAGTLRVRNIAGPAFSSQGFSDGVHLETLYADDLAVAANVSTYLVLIRHGANSRVGKVICPALNTNWLAAVFFRDTVNAILDDVYVGGSTPVGASAVRLNNADALLGNIVTDSLAKLAEVGTVTKRYKNNNLTGTLVWNPGSLADGVGETSAAITVTGAVFGDYVNVAAPYDLQGITCNGYVSAADTIKIRIQNETGGVIDLASGTWRVRVMKDY